MWYWISQVVGAGLFGLFLDNTRFTRRTRLWIGWGFTFVILNAIWGGGVAFLLKTDRAKKSPEADIFDHNYTWYLILYMFYGFLDAIWQTYCYYVMGALTNDPEKLAFYAGFYKSLQAAGATVIAALDGDKFPFANLFASSWALMFGGMFFALPVFIWRLQNTEVKDEEQAVEEKPRSQPAEGGAIEDVEKTLWDIQKQ
ncbi:DUF895 domain membrane protein [Aspergillus sclerotialis]|uniref:DUF895 domain membrane protein n=1 Tax=Aspergillus sclerotialis TaxID=2070753 RepID=A0A3A2ZXX6_9EURO|nr:DUF895 domain membrane protein [Aspergillus sclerotialis]